MENMKIPIFFLKGFLMAPHLLVSNVQTTWHVTWGHIFYHINIKLLITGTHPPTLTKALYCFLYLCVPRLGLAHPALQWAVHLRPGTGDVFGKSSLHPQLRWGPLSLGSQSARCENAVSLAVWAGRCWWCFVSLSGLQGSWGSGLYRAFLFPSIQL